MITRQMSAKANNVFWIVHNSDKYQFVYNSGCSPGNEPTTNKDFWVFETLDVTPPTVDFVSAAERYNENVTVIWSINEQNVTVVVNVKHVDTNTTVMGEFTIYTQSTVNF